MPQNSRTMHGSNRPRVVVITKHRTKCLGSEPPSTPTCVNNLHCNQRMFQFRNETIPFSRETHCFLCLSPEWSSTSLVLTNSFPEGGHPKSEGSPLFAQIGDGNTTCASNHAGGPLRINFAQTSPFSEFLVVSGISTPGMLLSSHKFWINFL